MNGIDKIIHRISEDTQKEIDQILADADAQVAAIQSQAKEQAEKESADALARGRRAAEERLERLKSAAKMEQRKMELAARQEMLGQAFDLALQKLCSLPEEEYVQLLTRLVLEASSTGREQLVFSPQDRARVGKQVVVAANEAMVKQVAPELPDAISDTKVGALLGKVVNSTTAMVTGTGMLTLSEETRPMKGGFVLVDGDVEINCAFETLVRLQREKSEKDAAQILFGN